MQYQTNYPYATSQRNGSISHMREEQRRRQQEYSQALAEQVAQREQQKQRDRAMDQQYGRHNGGFQSQQQQQQGSRQTGQGTFAPPERGMLDGLGRKDYQQPRKSFAHGQPQHQMQPHQHLPNVMPPPDYFPPALPQTQMSQAGQLQPNFPHANQQPPAENQGYVSDFGHPGHLNQQQAMAWQQQQQPQADFSSNNINMPSFASRHQGQSFWSSKNPHPTAMAQARASHAWPGQNFVEATPAPPAFAGYSSPQHEAQQGSYPAYPQTEPPQHPQVQNGGRRQRTDIHDGSRGESEEANRFQRKLQQQQEMQLALERQIEEKRQQKLEAKRRQEEEDRREMQRFEEDQRRQRAEQERLAEEKRRKAEIEQQKTEQAAAAVAAANEQAKIQQQQKLHSQVNQEQPQRPQFGQPFHQQQQHQLQPQFVQPVQQQQQQQFQPQSQQSELVAAASPPDRHKNPFTNSRAHLFEDPPQRSPQRDPKVHNSIYGHPNQNMSPIRGGGQGFPQKFDGGGRPVDPSELRRQYDDMRAELTRQKQLVDQLQQAQARIQHHQEQASPMRTESGAIPTLMDLEKLRNELRGELAYREQVHQKELASLKREQQPRQSPEQSPHRYPGVKTPLSLSIRAVPDSNRERVLTTAQTVNSNGVPSTHAVASQRIQQLRVRTPLDSSTTSLRGESEFVYFDERVTGAANGLVRDDEDLRNESNEDALDERSVPTKVEAPVVGKGPETSLSHSPTMTHNVHQSVSKSTVSISTKTRTKALEDADSDNDEPHEFVMRRSIQVSPLHKHSQQTSTSLPITYSRRAAASSHRYSRSPMAFASTSPLKQSEKWRLESLGTDANSSDSDDELDTSLSGEQLEALFQRNVRRHEILLGFQAKAQAQDSNQQSDGSHPRSKMAWAELHQQLESNRHATVLTQQKKPSSICSNNFESDNQFCLDTEGDEDALVASSRWMPSSLPLPAADNSRHNQYK